MKSRAQLSLRFSNPKVASVLAGTLSGEPARDLRVRRRGRIIVVDVVADGPMALLAIVDDYLARISAAERSKERARPPARRRRRRV